MSKICSKWNKKNSRTKNVSNGKKMCANKKILRGKDLQKRTKNIRSGTKKKLLNECKSIMELFKLNELLRTNESKVLSYVAN